MTNQEVKNKLEELQATFAAGKFWNHTPGTTNDPESVTNTACSHHVPPDLDTCDISSGSCGCNFFARGIQCHGFALYMAKKVFGSYPDVNGSPDPANGDDIGNGWKLYTGAHCANLTLEPGDVIRKTGHSAIIWSVDGQTVKVGEVWGNPTYAVDNCKIAWGYFNSKSSNTASVLLSNTTFVAKAPKDDSPTPPPTPANTYKITNVGASKCLNIHGDGLTSLSNSINVTLWSDSGTNEQKWVVSDLSSSVYIRSVIDTDYGLNVYRSGSPYNCNIYTISGNETDALVDIISSGNNYKVKLHNYDLYLTVGGSSNGTNVYWAASSDSSYQKWTFTEL